MKQPVQPAGALSTGMENVRYTPDGLVAAIAQERGTGKVLMMAWMTEATLRKTLESGRMVYWSRTRQEEWAKGDTSGNRQWVREAYYDCDGDTLLFVVDQEGDGACHTGEHTCFFRPFGDPAGIDPTE
ncbi:MAG TPA: phosphoribosyl-AMP cyclohydrolase [Acidimicrobiales bacterium]|nr:phosphoribosyl-AMP cyclohydrolase [Acidimicrobiales bacterium]